MNFVFSKNTANKLIKREKSAYKPINAIIFYKVTNVEKPAAEKITKFSLKTIEK